MKKINLVFIDDELTNLVRKRIIKKRYDDEIIETYCFDESQTGLDFIKESKEPIILILDLKMRDTEKQGIEILKEIRSFRKNIPVIIRSVNNEVTNPEFRELINNNITHFIKKATSGVDHEESQEKEFIENARRFLMKNISTALDEYINRREDRKEIRIVTKSGGDSIPLSGLLDEVNKESQQGIDFEKAIYKLAIELFIKEEG